MPHQPIAHRNPAIVINLRGPSRSISQPESGMLHVITAMKKLNPHWTWDNFQPVADMIGWTAIVHAYCRFPIMIMATTAAASRNQRFIVSGPPPVSCVGQIYRKQPCRGVYRPGIRHLDPESFS